MSEALSTINIGMAEMKVIREQDTGVIFALGSCVGISLYDSNLRIGCLAHIVLPNCSGPVQNAYKFADTCIPEMINLMKKLGSYNKNLIAKIAGGAQMFNIALGSSFGEIGKRNVETTKTTLHKHNIVLSGEDTGQNHGRTMYFYPETGDVIIKSFTKGVIKL